MTKKLRTLRLSSRFNEWNNGERDEFNGNGTRERKYICIFDEYCESQNETQTFFFDRPKRTHTQKKKQPKFIIIYSERSFYTKLLNSEITENDIVTSFVMPRS
jgi:hypothetical protein